MRTIFQFIPLLMDLNAWYYTHKHKFCQLVDTYSVAVCLCSPTYLHIYIYEIKTYSLLNLLSRRWTHLDADFSNCTHYYSAMYLYYTHPLTHIHNKHIRQLLLCINFSLLVLSYKWIYLLTFLLCCKLSNEDSVWCF